MKKRMINISVSFIMLAVIFNLASPVSCIADDFQPPWEAPKETYLVRLNQPAEKQKSAEKIYETNPAKLPFLWGLELYRKVISKTDGDKCGMYPTCSGYSRRAIKKHGAAIGLMMTADRLFHEVTEAQRAPLIEKYGVIRYYDPLENNDFWFYNKEDSS
jgi:hypothetical protein